MKLLRNKSRNHIAYAVFVTLLMLNTACAPTQTIEQSRDLSTSGLAYTQAVEALVDSTVDRIIDFDTTSLIKSRRGQAEDQLKMILTAQNQALSDLIKELETFKGQNKLLQSYFMNLQALADSPIKEDVGGSVSALSGSINELNKSLKGDLDLTPQQQTEIGKLAGLVAQSSQASKLKSALQRDAEIIATQLALHEQQLENITDILKDRFDAENELFFREQVEKPFSSSDQAADLGPAWRSAREQYLRTQFNNEKLATAQVAAKQLRGVWTDILQGRNDTGSLRVLISDINEFVTSIENLN